jgi:thiamine-monophosphate kinase
VNERERILHFAAHLPRAPGPLAEPFDCDAELIGIGGERWAITVDEFTPEEDAFTAEDPVRLGRNLAAATVSDLFAAGAVPRFFLSSLALPRALDAGWLDGLSRGLGASLAELGCVHSGGDLGTAEPWRFNGIALGPVLSPAPLTHRLPDGPQTLCVTGALGDLNLAAFLGTPTSAIELRAREADLIRRLGTACVDTSGGFFDALWLLHECNPGRRFVVDRAAIPLAEGVAAAARARGWPPEAALLGGAGEYELLFAMPSDRLASARGELAARGISVVGEVRGGAGGVAVRWEGAERPFAGPPPDPRAAGSAAEHAQAVLRAAAEFFS